MTTFSTRLTPASSGTGVKTIYSSIKPTSPVQPLQPLTMEGSGADAGCKIDTLDFIVNTLIHDNAYTVDSVGNFVWTEVPVKFSSPILNLVIPRPLGSLSSLRFTPVKLGFNSEWYAQSVAGIPLPMYQVGNQYTWYQFCSPVDILYFSYAIGGGGGVVGDILAVIIGSTKISNINLSNGVPL